MSIFVSVLMSVSVSLCLSLCACVYILHLRAFAYIEVITTRIH